ncbi:hypothetical protein Phi13:1_gp009 [Cellulophaga phage phi13:1]|uniref:Uncharacterized protein n=1 Tax=Cellulophaga phage phi13:1 TaxID=1327992 RepID=S0A2J7_9CAUD|nr:hypothetical protein Phi13:1_gp009 [Cellulophaga phage phi13:1]
MSEKQENQNLLESIESEVNPALTLEVIPTEAELAQIKYHDLIKKFEELGVPEAWKAGTKAKDMIKTAIDKLTIIKQLQDQGVEDSLIKDQADKLYLENIDKADKKNILQNIKKQQIEIKAEKTLKQTMEDLKLSPQEIDKNIAMINSLVKTAENAQRSILLAKLNILLEMKNR